MGKLHRPLGHAHWGGGVQLCVPACSRQEGSPAWSLHLGGSTSAGRISQDTTRPSRPGVHRT